MSTPTFTIRPDEEPISPEARSDEAVRSTGVIEVSEVGPHVVVGESHLRLVNLPEFQTQFDNYIYSLERGDFILVEHYSAPEWNLWTRQSTVRRFMQQAEQYPDVSNGINLQVLDDVPHWTVLESSITVAGISRSDLLYASGLHNAFVVLPTQNGLQSLLVDLEQSTFLSVEDKVIYKRGVDRFSAILHLSPEDATQQMESLMTLLKLYAELDSVCRERSYQERIGGVKRQNPDSKLLVVVGKSHRLGIAEALADPEYRTPFDDQQVQEFKLLVELFK